MTLVINKGVGIALVLEMIYHIAVTFLPMAIPLSALFATMFILGKMSQDSEIIAMRSFSLSRFEIFKPFAITGIIIALIAFSMNRSLIPFSKREFKKILTVLTSKGFLSDIKKGNFYTQIPNVTIFAEDVKDKGKELTKVFIHTTNVKQGLDQVISSKKGVLTKNEDLETGVASLRLHLTDGNIIKNFTSGKDTEKILFREYDFPVSANDMQTEFVTKDSMRSNEQLLKIMRLSKKKRENMKMPERDYRKTQIEFWSRVNTPILCFLFVFLGFGLGIQNARGKRRNTSLLCLLIIIFYYAIFFLGISMAKKGSYPPFLAIFTPSLLAALVGVKLYKDLEWVA